MYLKKKHNSVRLGSLDWSWACHPVVSAFCVLRLQVCTTTPGKTVSTLGLNIWAPQNQQAEMHPGEQWDKHATRAQLHPRHGADLGCSRQSVTLRPQSSSSFILTRIRAAGSRAKAGYNAMPLSAGPTHFDQLSSLITSGKVTANKYNPQQRHTDQTPQAPLIHALFQISESRQEFLPLILESR